MWANHPAEVLRQWALASANPLDPDVSCQSEAIRQLCGVMLDVANVHQLMLELRHRIPRETAVQTLEIKRVDRAIDHRVADTPVFEHLRLRVWIGRDAILISVLLRPPSKCRFVPLEV